MKSRAALAWMLLVAVAVTTGCGTQRYEEGDRAAPSTTTPAAQESPGEPPELEGPPSVVIDHGDVELSLQAWTTCWSSGASSMCADGMPPQPLPELGQVTSDVLVSFPVEGWTFHASQRAQGTGSSEAIRSRLEPVDEDTWRLSPGGPAGRYEVDVWGDGPQGDVIVSFAMTTTADGPSPSPTK